MGRKGQKIDTKKKLNELKASDTGRSLIKEIMFNFYNTLEYIEEGKKKGVIKKEDYNEIKKEFDKLESKLKEKGIID